MKYSRRKFQNFQKKFKCHEAFRFLPILRRERFSFEFRALQICRGCLNERRFIAERSDTRQLFPCQHQMLYRLATSWCFRLHAERSPAVKIKPIVTRQELLNTFKLMPTVSTETRAASSQIRLRNAVLWIQNRAGSLRYNIHFTLERFAPLANASAIDKPGVSCERQKSEAYSRLEWT